VAGGVLVVVLAVVFDTVPGHDGLHVAAEDLE
jgi:hypothetical protein